MARTIVGAIAAFAFLVVVAKALSYLPCDGVGGGMRLFFSISCR
jgi:hypothetical protein